MRVTSGVVVRYLNDFVEVSPIHFYPLKEMTKCIKKAEVDKMSEEIFAIIQTATLNIRKDNSFKRVVIIGDIDIEPLTIEGELRQLYLERVLEGDSGKMKQFKLHVDKFPADNDKAFNG